MRECSYGDCGQDQVRWGFVDGPRGWRAGTPAPAPAVPGVEELDLQELARVLSSKLMAMPRDGHGSCKAVLQGCLEVLRDLVEIEGPDGTLLEGTKLGKVWPGRCRGWR